MSGKRRKKTTKKTPQKKKRTIDELPAEARGWILFCLGAMMLVSLLSFAYGEGSTNWLGLVGYTLGWLQTAFLGLSGYFLALYIGWIGWRIMFKKSINNLPLKHLTIALLILSTSMILTALEELFPQSGEYLGSFFYTQLSRRNLHFHLGGAPAYFLYKDFPLFNLERVLNSIGVLILFGSLLATSLLILTKTDPRSLLRLFQWVKEQWIEIRAKRPAPVTQEIVPSLLRTVKLRIPSFSPQRKDRKEEHDTLQIQPEINLRDRPSLSKKTLSDLTGSQPFEGHKERTALPPELEKTSLPKQTSPIETKKDRRQRALNEQSVYNGDFTAFNVPQPTLLTPPKKVDQSSLKTDLRRQAEVLEETLLSFGIEAKVGQINCGPTITSFEVHPAIGVKVQKIKALENDIALNMEAKSIRIIAPIPGKAAIGIEVPNPNPQEVGFKELLTAYQQGSKKYEVPLLLGKTVNGDYVTEDLCRMPHVIIAGATGSGKSVCINTIVMSILMNAKPDEIKLIMVDPKKVELTPYTRLPHMLAPVITEPAGACAALAWLVKEMENRYEILKQVGYRNIASFNSRKIDKEFEEGLNREIPVKMHYIVCIIDELADLMMVSSNDIETHIARIAQMARAVGIHLILATQRPSREVITGLIKANFPTRIAFKVSSRINSQIILDEVGAEMLLGNGDMLMLPPGMHHLIRAQGAYIRDEDINAVVQKICSQAPPNYVIESFDRMDSLSALDGDGDDGSRDPLYDQALEVVLSTGNASTTFLQRKLKIGYARAASIMDQLEDARVIGPADGSKPRKILVKTEVLDEELL
jgi:DNA segregation ATPase FtsK/SpoIIIE, S-DNA-T family